MSDEEGSKRQGVGERDGPGGPGGPDGPGELRELRVVVAGYGTVGRNVHRVLTQRHDELAARYGIDVRVVGIARSDRAAVDAKGLSYDDPRTLPWTAGETMELLWDADADVLLELTPTDLTDGQPGLGHVRTALHKGMGVVLANKGPVVVAHDELVERAAKAGVPLRFEATVAGCVPTLNAARYGFAGDRVTRVEGILNGTTNFILNRMADEGSDLDQALTEAQALGYAETDPTNDVEGLDAAAKVVILANALLGQSIGMEDVDITGIMGVTRQAVELATAHGFRVKLVAEADADGTARVGPRLVRRGSTLDIPGVLNAVRFTTELAGTVTHVGAGAGGQATAAAVLSDLVDVARAL